MIDKPTEPMPLQPRSTPERDAVIEQLRLLEEAVNLLPITAKTMQIARDRDFSLRAIRDMMEDIRTELGAWRDP